jgi:hypothetical protein
MGNVQLRALRNGLIAALIMAAAGFGLNALFGSEPAVSARGSSPTSSVSPGCRPTFEPLERTLARGVHGTVLGLSATAEDDVWAVGFTGATQAAALTSIARWDGRTWKQVESPDTSIVDVLTDVDAISADAAWASGWSRDDGVARGLLARWDGRTWRPIAAPAAADGMTLTGVATAGDREVWAVGHTGDPQEGTERAALVLWDGDSLRLVAAPIGTGRSALRAVDAGGPDDVWAVGYQRNSPLVLRYDGSSWQRMLDVEAHGGLVAVSVAGPDEAWAVGASVLRWNGTAWAEVGALPGDVTATAVSASGPGRSWIVGFAGSPERARSVVLQATVDALTRSAAVRVRGADRLTTTVVVGELAWAAGYRETTKAISPVFGRIVACEQPD